MSRKSTLSNLALLVKNGNPRAFDEFVLELDSYEKKLVDDLVMSDTGEILKAAGRVQSIRALLRILKECHIQPKTEEPAPE